MKNITLAVEEDVLSIVRRHAAERNSTVNGLVREYLTNLAAQEDRARQARARLRELSSQSRGRIGRKTWKRDDLHGGDCLRGTGVGIGDGLLGGFERWAGVFGSAGCESVSLTGSHVCAQARSALEGFGFTVHSCH